MGRSGQFRRQQYWSLMGEMKFPALHCAENAEMLMHHCLSPGGSKRRLKGLEVTLGQQYHGGETITDLSAHGDATMDLRGKTFKLMG